MPYRPFGRYRQVQGVPAGDQWPDPPDDLRRAVDGEDEPTTQNRFERWVYRLLDRPSLLPRRRTRGADR
jgi:hypothetical protein